MSLAKIRNIGIVAHIDAGKTTVSERVLFYSGVERRMGEVHEGNATMDWMEEERKRGITITAAATSIPWRGHTINLIDTPGHVDFTVEVERSMRVLDGAVLVVNGVAGVQAQSETVWRQMARHGVCCVGFVNQLDRSGADFFRCINDMRKKLRAPAVPIQYPIGEGRDFRSVVDLISRRTFEFSEEELGRDPREGDIPGDVADEVAVLRYELIELLAEENEEILTAFLEDQEPDPELLTKELRRRTISGTLVPVLVGSALRNVGVQLLMDAVLAYLPSPAEVPPIRGVHPKTGEKLERPHDPDGALCALAFKLAVDPNEDLLFVRIYSGRLRAGQKVFNPRVGRMERIARVLRMHADSKKQLEGASAGEIVVLSGFKFTATGDTLCEHDEPLVLEPLVFPEPVITRVVEPESTSDRDKLRAALDRLVFEDPTFRVREDEETGQWLIEGMGELHLEIKEHRLASDFHLRVRVGEPRVAYREAAVARAVGKGRVERVVAGSKVFGAVGLEVAPPAPSAFDRKGEDSQRATIRWAEDCQVPASFRPAVEESLALELDVGPRFGFPLGAVRVTITGGESHPDSDAEAGFTQAASMALREAFGATKIVLLEPLMAFSIEAPSEFMSGIIGEMNAKKADIRELGAEGESRSVSGRVPLFHMFGYATTLRSLSQGRASFSLEPAGFARVPEAELEARGLVWS